jgi:uncharacterized protein (DUF2267 family)
MAELINELASQSGISTEQAQKGLGAVLGFLKSRLPADTYARVSAAVPDGASAAAAEPPAQEPGGLLSGLAGAIGKLFGGGGAAQELVAKFTHLGFSAEQLQTFLPRVMEFLRGKLPDDVMKQISGLLPAPQESAH